MASKYITRDDFIKSRFGNQNKSYYVLLRKCNLSFSPAETLNFYIKRLSLKCDKLLQGCAIFMMVVLRIQLSVQWPNMVKIRDVVVYNEIVTVPDSARG